MSPLLSVTHGEVKGLELSVKAPDRGAEGPERTPIVESGQDQSLQG